MAELIWQTLWPDLGGEAGQAPAEPEPSRAGRFGSAGASRFRSALPEPIVA
jgi:hypothetical protein